MIWHRSPRAASIAALVALLVLAGGRTPGAAARAAGAAAPPPITIRIASNALSPRAVTVDADTPIRWVNEDRVARQIQGVMNASELEPVTIPPGGTFVFSWRLPGTYDVILAGNDSTDAAITVREAPGGAVFFPETGHAVRGRFLRYWRAHGLDLGYYNQGAGVYRQSLALFGYPLTDEFRERLEDGNEYTVQYFERARFEYHPENPEPAPGAIGQEDYTVLLGQFGRALHPADPPVPPPGGNSAYFPETGHSLGGAFRTFFDRNGGLPTFGYPLSEPFEERLEDGRVYAVQYFERARFELHLENQAPYGVLLGQFGRRILAGRGRR
jgi:plastocyanin